MDKIDCAVIGAGVVGLAVARRLAADGREVLILEAGTAFGTGISARNSEVVHAGIYYPAGSLKARLCVSGRCMLYAYCGERGITHRRCGKLIVATSEPQRAELGRIAAAARANGVDDLERLSREEARALEPALECTAALLSPSTGIIDSHALMLSLLGDAERDGAVLALQSRVQGGEVVDGGIVLDIVGESGELTQLLAASVANCAGLGAQDVARGLRGLPPESVPPLYYAKGNYYALAGPAPFSRLIYPVPETAGLGVHLTLDLAGVLRLGPDAEYVARRDDFAPAEHKHAAFLAAARALLGPIAAEQLVYDGCGIRPKLRGPDEPDERDFVIAAGPPGCLHLLGIESPGLTAALALAERVAQRFA